MNWGKGIAIFIFMFVVFMSTLVYMSVSEDFYLVSDTYYSDGLNYDQVQEKIINVKSLENKIDISQSKDKINVNMPTEVKGGMVHFFRPSNGTLDFNIAISSKEFYVNKTKMKVGKWIMKLSWTDGIKEYYIEEGISVL